MARYENLYTWAKYGEIIFPSSESLDGFEKHQLHLTFQKSFHDFLRIDLEGRQLPYISKKALRKISESFFEKQKEVEDKTAVTTPKKAKKWKKEEEKILSKKDMFDAMLANTQKKEDFIKHIENVAIRHTRIPLTIFAQYFHKRFSKHVFLETTLELLHQAYIQMVSVSQDYNHVPGDKCLYTLKCTCCREEITASGSIASTLYHAPIAILYHLGFFVDDQLIDDIELKMIPLLFGSMGAFRKCISSFDKSMNIHVKMRIMDTKCMSKRSVNQRRLTLQKHGKLTTMILSQALFPSSLLSLKTLGLLLTLLKHTLRMSTLSNMQAILCC
jgi:hypothetical protein